MTPKNSSAILAPAEKHTATERERQDERALVKIASSKNGHGAVGMEVGDQDGEYLGRL